MWYKIDEQRTNAITRQSFKFWGLYIIHKCQLSTKVDYRLSPAPAMRKTYIIFPSSVLDDSEYILAFSTICRHLLCFWRSLSSYSKLWYPVLLGPFTLFSIYQVWSMWLIYLNIFDSLYYFRELPVLTILERFIFARKPHKELNFDSGSIACASSSLACTQFSVYLYRYTCTDTLLRYIGEWMSDIELQYIGQIIDETWFQTYTEIIQIELPNLRAEHRRKSHLLIVNT